MIDCSAGSERDPGGQPALELAAGVRRRLERWAGAALDLLYPPCCVLCGDPQPLPAGQPQLCPVCQGEILTVRAPACRCCAAPLAVGAAPAEDCPRCRPRRYHFQAAVALGIYRGRLRQAVLHMKQAAHEPLALALGQLLAGQLRRRLPGWPPDLLAPVPMHWSRRLLRGGNCTEVLVESLTKSLRLPALASLLACRRKARKQGMLSPQERFRNVRGVFRVAAGYDIRGAHLLLVDDVMTTGATASEAARVLRRAGARRVSIAVAARGVGVD